MIVGGMGPLFICGTGEGLWQIVVVSSPVTGK